jgi:hypothetical protein
MYKTAFLNKLREENDQWEALLAEIGEDRMDTPGVAEQWSIKDIVAHLTGWRRRSVARLQAAARHEREFASPWPPHLETDDEINAWIFDANHKRSVREVLDDSRQSFQDLVAAIDAFSDEELQDPQRFPWMEGEQLRATMYFEHFHEEHEPDMRAWLARQQTSPV